MLGRRGPAEAAFTVPELVGLAGLSDIDVVVDTGGVPIVPDGPVGPSCSRSWPPVPQRPGRRRMVLRFRTAPVRVLGEARVTGVEVARTEPAAGGSRTVAVPTEETEALALRSRAALGGLPGACPSRGCRSTTASGTVAARARPGPAGRCYVAGWVKRGPTGFIGTNKTCAEETVAGLLADLEPGCCRRRAATGADLDARPARRGPDGGRPGRMACDPGGGAGRGRCLDRPRAKIVDVTELVAASRGGPPCPLRRARAVRRGGAGRPGRRAARRLGLPGVSTEAAPGVVRATGDATPGREGARWEAHRIARRTHILEAAIAVIERERPR